MSPGVASAVSERSWSWASALVGKSSSAVPGRTGAAAASAMGIW